MRIAPLAAGLAGIVFVTSLAMAQPAGPPAAHAPEPAPTNLQVLPRDIPHERLIAIMRSFATAMGQRCGFCHMPGDFASDANPHKNIARGMMRMTARINGELLPPVIGAAQEMRVTCYTCHRGSPEPAIAAPPPAAAAPPPPAAPVVAPTAPPPHQHH